MSSAVIAAVTSVAVSAITGGITMVTTRSRIRADVATTLLEQEGAFRLQEERLRTELRTEFMAEEAIHALLNHPRWTQRSFEEIKRRVRGFSVASAIGGSGRLVGRTAARRCGGFESGTLGTSSCHQLISPRRTSSSERRSAPFHAEQHSPGDGSFAWKGAATALLLVFHKPAATRPLTGVPADTCCGPSRAAAQPTASPTDRSGRHVGDATGAVLDRVGVPPPWTAPQAGSAPPAAPSTCP
jgi:hypothetical protein